MFASFALALPACDDGSGDDGGGGGATGMAGATGASGSTGTGGSGTDTGVQVTWNDTGWIEGADNDFGIVGSWYSYDDCADATAAGLTCTTRDASLTGPDMKTGWAVQGTGGGSKVCAKGTATKVSSAMFAKQWGFGIAFDLNSPAMMTKGPYNATANSIKGFSFTIEGSAPAKLRINLPMSDPDSASYFREVSVPSSGAANQVIFTDSLNFHQGSWVAMQTPALVKTFDPTSIYAVQFQVFTGESAATPFDFCVSNFRVIQ
jgi:hypothetical protein